MKEKIRIESPESYLTRAAGFFRKDGSFRLALVSLLTVLVTDRLARYYETVTKHNLKYRRYYHQFDY